MDVNYRAANPHGRDYRGLHRDDIHASVFPGAHPYRCGDYPYGIRWVRVGGAWMEDCADLDVVCGPRAQGEWQWEKSRLWAVFDCVGVCGLDDCKWTRLLGKGKVREG